MLLEVKAQTEEFLLSMHSKGEEREKLEELVQKMMDSKYDEAREVLQEMDDRKDFRIPPSTIQLIENRIKNVEYTENH